MGGTATGSMILSDTEAGESELRPADRGARGGFRPDIEGLRALAVLAVLAYHLELPGASGGFVGVDVFFVISGYLITGHLVADTLAGRGVRFTDFYARRVRRILPAATATIVASVAMGMAFLDPLDTALLGDDARSSALFFSNIWFWSESTDYLAESRSVSLFQQYWSLSLEEQFYIIWPIVIGFIAWAAVRSASGHTRRVRRWLASTLLVLVVASFLLSVHAASNDPVGGFFLLQFRWWELGLGALLALTRDRVGPLAARHATAIGAIGLLAVLISVNRYSGQTTWPGLPAAVPVVGTALVIAAGIDNDRNAIGRLISVSPFQLVGRYSYSLYLWHWPLVVLVATPRGYSIPSVLAVMVMTFLAAAGSYHLVEHPFRVSRRLQERTRLTLAVGAALIGLGVATPTALAFLGPDLDAGRSTDAPPHQAGDPVRPTEFVPSNVTPPLAEGTNDADPNAARNVDCDDIGDCTSGSTDAAFHLVLFGDSHADQWATAFRQFTESKQGRFDRLTKGGCQTFELGDLRDKGRPQCGDFLAKGWRDIERLAPDVLVLVNFYGGNTDGAGRMMEVVRSAPAETQVVVLSQTPIARTSVPHCLARNVDRASRCEPPWPNANVGEVNDILERSVTSAGATYLDVTSLLCVEDRCPAIAGNILVYRDNHHLTTAFVESRAGDLALLLEQHLE